MELPQQMVPSKEMHVAHLVRHQVDGGVQAVLLIFRPHHAIAQCVDSDLCALPSANDGDQGVSTSAGWSCKGISVTRTAVTCLGMAPHSIA